MRPGRRRDIRQKLRQASQGSRPPSSPPPPPALCEVACLCGQLLRMAPSPEEKRYGCPACGRRFVLSFSKDPASGRQIGHPIYIDDPAVSGETLIPEAPGAKKKPSSKGELDDFLSPAPPEALAVACPGCGRRMRVKKAYYDSRARCPDCGVRMLLTLVYDPIGRAHSIQALRVSDAPSGDTWHPGQP
jgi:DNA-directed RNA polymerase subunit RPC12/RpoP